MEPEEAEAEILRLREEARQRNKEWRMANEDAVRRHLNKYRKKRIIAAIRKAWEERKGYTRPVPSKEQRRQALRYQRRKTRTIARERPEILRLAIQKLLPGYLTPPARMDVVNSVMELALANRVRHDGLADTVRECVTAHNRQYDYFKTISTDAPITGTDGLTRADLIDSETFHF